MARRLRPLPSWTVNGWTVSQRPNTFAERFAFTAVAFDAQGVQTAKRGFQRKRDAVAFAQANTPPAVRAPEPTQAEIDAYISRLAAADLAAGIE